MEMARVHETSISAIIRFRGGERNGQHVIAEELASAVAGSTPVQPGTAILTSAGRLRGTHGVHYIIHVAAVAGEPEAGFRQVANIGVCATNALFRAEALDVDGSPAKSILIPILGTGEGRGEIRPTIRALLDATVEHLDSCRETTLGAVYFLAYFDVELDEFMNYVADHPFLAEVRS
jgi:O-acetyl-ADP-ribose deacetylase (regulator of RNase III)